jgi:hypothetical protein
MTRLVYRNPEEFSEAMRKLSLYTARNPRKLSIIDTLTLKNDPELEMDNSEFNRIRGIMDIMRLT